jgi:hypothetical protein
MILHCVHLPKQHTFPHNYGLLNCKYFDILQRQETKDAGGPVEKKKVTLYTFRQTINLYSHFFLNVSFSRNYKEK